MNNVAYIFLFFSFFFFLNESRCVCTNLLGFLLIIPITTSFIEGRSPPFISPIYSPCETIERITHQDEARLLFSKTEHFIGGLRPAGWRLNMR